MSNFQTFMICTGTKNFEVREVIDGISRCVGMLLNVASKKDALRWLDETGHFSSVVGRTISMM